MRFRNLSKFRLRDRTRCYCCFSRYVTRRSSRCAKLERSFHNSVANGIGLFSNFVGKSKKIFQYRTISFLSFYLIVAAIFASSRMQGGIRMFNNKPRKKRNKSKKRKDVRRKEETVKYNQAQNGSIVKGNGIANFLRAHSNHGASCLSRFSFRYLSLTKFPFRSGGNKAYSKQRLAVYMHTALSVLVFKCLSRWNKILIPTLALSPPFPPFLFAFLLFLILSPLVSLVSFVLTTCSVKEGKNGIRLTAIEYISFDGRRQLTAPD